jgi:hypothetical protein
MNGCTWSIGEIKLTGENWGTRRKTWQPLCPLQTTFGQAWVWTQTFMVKGQWLIAWAMAQTTEIKENVPSNKKSYVQITFTAASTSSHHMNAMQCTFKHTWFYKHLTQGKGKVSLSTPRRYIGGLEVQFHSFTALALQEGEGLTLCPICCRPMKEPWYPVNSRMGGIQSQSGSFGE